MYIYICMYTNRGLIEGEHTGINLYIYTHIACIQYIHT